MSKKRWFPIVACIGLFVLMAFTPGTPETDTSGKIELVHLNGQVWLLKGGLGNVAVMYDSTRILMVDTKWEKSAREVDSVLKARLGNREVSCIINTHMHFDHTGGNVQLGKRATIIGHARSRHSLEQDKSAMPRSAWPNLLVDSSLDLVFNGEEIKVIHFPASHTDHDLVVWFPQSKVIALGDMYFAHMFPFVTEEGSIQVLIKNLGTLIDWLPEDVKIIPGHGPVSTLDELRATRNMLIETSGFMQQQIKAGKSLEEIKKQGLPEKWNAWGNGWCKADCWIETLYEHAKK